LVFDHKRDTQHRAVFGVDPDLSITSTDLGKSSLTDVFYFYFYFILAWTTRNLAAQGVSAEIGLAIDKAT
jgi:hypothetical protein